MRSDPDSPPPAPFDEGPEEAHAGSRRPRRRSQASRGGRGRGRTVVDGGIGCMVTAMEGPAVLPDRALQNWSEVWTGLEALLHVEVVWLFRIAGFWVAIVILVHLVPYRRM